MSTFLGVPAEEKWNHTAMHENLAASKYLQGANNA